MSDPTANIGATKPLPTEPPQGKEQVIASLVERGMALCQDGRFSEGEAAFRRVLEIEPRHFETLHFLGMACSQQGRHAEALGYIDVALQIDPAAAAAHSSRGNVLAALQRFDAALETFDRALALDPESPIVLGNRGVALQELKRFDEAVKSYDQAIALGPEDAEIHHSRGTALEALGRLEQAVASYDKAIALRPDYVDAFSNRGVALQQLNRVDEALASYERAIALRPDFPEVFHNRGNALRQLERFDAALASYDRAIALNPEFAEAWNNRGATLAELKRFDEALRSYAKAAAINPAYVDALVNLGDALRQCGRHGEAVAQYDRALGVRPDHVEVLVKRGVSLELLKRYHEAVESFERALAVDPDDPRAFEGLAHSALMACDWARTARLAPQLAARVCDATCAIWPFTFLTYCGDPALQLRCASAFLNHKIPVRPAPLWNGERWRNTKIRLAYLAAGFHQHPVAYLTAELFEIHDRTRFEVLGISIGPDDRSEIRARLIRAFDQFHDVQAESDRDIAALIHELRVDILVDRSGYSTDARPQILAYRPAPIRVNYLGYPGTLGDGLCDYLIADALVLPFDQQPFVSERIVHLPDCYQVNDRKRNIAATPTRRSAGLPDRGFVFCCFNSSGKINAPMFDIWMRLLRRIDDGVLWLLGDGSVAEDNLRKEAAVRGIDPARIVFARRVKLEEHLARHRLADLFLDTLPYNAHTTASDALWAGLPLVTCRGASFPGRVAASILNAVGLPELVTQNLEDYEKLALRLATDASELDRIRQKLRRNRLAFPLFDSDRYRRHIEAAYLQMWELWQRGECPRSFAVPPERNELSG